MKTIRHALTRNLLLTVGLLLLAVGVAVYACTRASLLAQFDAALEAKAQAIGSLTEEKHGRIELEFSDERMRSFDTGGHDFFELLRADGTLVERSPSLQKNNLPLPDGLSERPLFWNVNLPDGHPGRAVAFKFDPQADDESPKPPSLDAICLVASSSGELDETLATLRWVLAGGGLALMALVALVVPHVLKRELRPLQQLADEAARMDAGSLSARFSTAGLPGELTPITARLNELLARLEESFERERRFSSDVAHEFRTPVAELRSLAELTIKLPDTRTPQTDHDMLAIAQHLESILARLLTLTRGERQALAINREPVSLDALARSVCEKFRDKAAAHHLQLNCHVPTEAAANTDPVLLTSILTNLVDNAVEYSQANTVVDMSITTTRDGFSLSVTNTVRDLVEGDLPHLFDRFWRKDSARTADGHTGLGLSLARTFAITLGGELNAEFTAPGRLTMTLEQSS